MPFVPQKSSQVLAVGLVLAVLFGSVGCRNRADAPGETINALDNTPGDASQAETSLVVNSDAAGQAAAAAGFQSTPINPPRTAYLASQTEGAQINVRSQPTTESDSLGFGQSGNRVDLLRLAEGEGGYSWYFLKITESQTEGWIRGDFIDTTGEAVPPAATTPAAETTAEAEEPEDQGVCGRDRPEAYFETASYAIHICRTAEGMRYVGLNKENQDSLVTEDVRNSQGTYVAIDNQYQYHINTKALTVYQVNQGDYQQLVDENVTRHEKFIY